MSAQAQRQRKSARRTCATQRQDPDGKPDQRSIYARVTNRIIAELEQGTIPWARPWGSATGSASLPCNARTARPYSGVNILLLWGAVMERGFAFQSWLTFRQALDAGGSVRKGEKGTQIVYADRFTPERERGRVADAGDEPRSIPFLKVFTVFNIVQCEGLPDHFFQNAEPSPEPLVIAGAEALIDASNADVRIGGNEAYYSPAGDYVRVPPQCAFAEPIDYYRTALHELGHWTGHESRLGRDQTGRFGSPAYAREELVAELSAAFLCARLSIEPTVRHAAYVQSWLNVLRSDERAIFKAASLASRAADHLLSYRKADDGPPANGP
jgi:antirestriction protein ArdC